MGESAVSNAGQQRFEALEVANRVRLARAGIKEKVREGELSVAEVVLSCPWQIQGMSISDLLMSQRRWGLSRCRRLLVSVGIPEDKRIGTLTERQRVALVSVLEAKVEPGIPAAFPRLVRERALSAV
ncbi:MAG: hypothetical protein ACR2FZ_00095 [Thermoleophilaceae bacterium]|nr:hypothetical protein [Thermoleophilaceae bacterium]